MNNSDLPKANTKHQYQKPRLRTIELRADEVLAVGCKNVNGTNVGDKPCYANDCVQDGS